MTGNQKLVLIKTLHTIIWVFFNLVLASLFYAVILEKIDKWFWIGIGTIIMECLILIAFKWACPLTIVARKYSDSTKENFDIYLPNWLAKHNKLIYSIIFGLLLFLYFYKNIF